jgi:hypothetical protein
MFAAIRVARSDSQLCEETLSSIQSQNDHLKTANLMRRQICHARSEIHSVPVLTHVSTFGIGEKCEIKFPDIRGAECPEGGIMIRISVLSLMFALAVGVACAQQLPPQPRPVASAMGQGNDQERAACHPDVTRFCQTQLQINPNDVLGILGCLQTNRSKISRACQQVLASHGQ